MQRLRSCLPRQPRSSSQSSPSGLGSIPRTTRDARYRLDTLKEMYKHCSRHSFSISIFRLYQITLLLTLSAPFVGIVTPVYFNNCTSSFISVYFYHLYLLKSSCTPLYHWAVFLVCLPVSVCIYKQRPPYQHPLEDYPSV